jgi:hypothetical protein
MFKNTRTVSMLPVIAALWGAAGCAGLDHIGRNLDMVSEHMASAQPVYVGHLKSARRVGSMVALQFSDGQYFDVRQCPSALLPGDVVRIYKTDNGYEAHLWRSSQGQLQAAGESQPAPTTRHGS